MHHYELALKNLERAETADEKGFAEDCLRIALVHAALSISCELAAMVEELGRIGAGLTKMTREVKRI